MDKEREVTKGKNKFGWFDWLIFIASALLVLMYFYLFILNIFGGVFYNSGKPETSIVITFFWLIIFFLAFNSKYQKFKKVGTIKNKQSDKH